MARLLTNSDGVAVHGISNLPRPDIMHLCIITRLASNGRDRLGIRLITNFRNGGGPAVGGSVCDILQNITYST
jgi:hypothetical protein